MGSMVLTGADRLHTEGKRLLEGKRFALLTNPTGMDGRFRSTIELCAELASGKLVAFFACEHGLRNEVQAGVWIDDHTDPVYGLPVYSLYGKNRKPTAEMLHDLDTIVFDVQDLGVRFYTYLTTLVYVLEACAEHGTSLIVLDRPNPLGGYGIEGGFLGERFRSMVGAWRMPARTGMTIGEFARLVNGQSARKCDLEVVALEGWDRGMEYPDTGLPWVMPSPNMPTMDTVRVYAGNCLFEGTNLSEGRGTTKPFELVGAPWLRNADVCEALNRLGLRGVHFQPATFTPMFQKHQGALCRGVMTYVTDREAFRSTEAGLYLLHAIQRMHPEDFAWYRPELRLEKDGEVKQPPYFIDILTGSDAVRRTLHEPGGLEAILAGWRKDSEAWREIRRPYLLYEEQAAWAT
ncbi:exo-beta-N-acetylmuramidase NamZ family protein [Paenibacillus macerans]|uniref:exo-beta-N-acetylmuramidase NamZ family protein n=1 Tax=Paenibacillus macerans TaxID=44252 RepID=UPI003D3207A9